MRRKLLFPALLAIALLFALPLRAQITRTLPQSVSQTLAATGTACTGSNQTFNINNIGQTQHTLIAVASSTTKFHMWLYGVDQNGNFVLISDITQSAGSSTPTIATGSGYFPQIEAVVNCTGAGSSFALTYSGISSQPVPNVGSYLATMIDKVFFSGVSATSSESSGSFVPPFANSSGILSFVFSNGSGSTGSSLSISCVSTGQGAQSLAFSFTPANNTNNQNFIVPAVPCPQISVSYTPGTGSSGTFTLEYAFNNQASPATATSYALVNAINDAPLLAEKGARWSATATPAAGTQGTVTKAGVTGAYHVIDCISYSAGAITAPTATALTLQLENNTTTIWSKTIDVPATTGMHVNHDFCGLNLIGGQGLSMTLQFSAGLTNESESVSMTGYDVQ